ncbi:Tyrosine recombinase XerD [Riemerella anatipestifer]|uniref:Tyrosine recombinase XerD n=1 Tax=Riemerella anatipestifer TaxID=34085 RepID=A0A1S7DUF5_RIEAN|nr:Tyrosine recombinase XerD [Riemerella anatipestifer]
MKYNFYLKNTPDKNGNCPIYINIRLNKQRIRIPSEIKVQPKHWDKKKRKVVDSDFASDYNLILKQIESKITNIAIQYRLSETPLTPEKLIEHLRNAPPNFDLVQFFEHILNIQDLSKSTIIKHKGIFQKLKKSRISSFFPDINIMWFDKYRAYLRSIGNNSSTINTNISIIKKYLKLAKDYGIKLYVNLDYIKVGATAGRIIWLNESEIEKLKEYYFSSYIPDYLKMTLGYFLFSCYTGMRISDVLKTKRIDLENNIINFISTKTKKEQIIGINESCRSIINHYPDLFISKKSEVNINLQLKEIAKFLSIKKNITFHVARHTFATNYLLKGGKVENLQKLLGHSKITTTMKYVHIIDEEAAMTVNLLD